jgi:hypothetical protein
MYDAQNYLAANPDVQDYYDTNKAALLAGGDERYETPEGFGKWHYETVGKWENRNLTPTHDAGGNVIPTPEGAANTRAANQQTALAAANLANPAREGLSSLQRVTDTALATDIGEIQAYDATERQKINQVIGYMNQNAVSPYRLSTATQIPLANIQAGMHPYYQSEEERKAVTPTADTNIQTYLQQLIAGSGRTPYATGMASGGIASLATQGRYFGGPTDGMGDVIPATIDRQEPAMLSDGEFVIPADVVSHFGNGNSDAGAEQLFGMMDRVRRARTGTPSQGREINPMQYTLA